MDEQGNKSWWLEGGGIGEGITRKWLADVQERQAEAVDWRQEGKAGAGCMRNMWGRGRGKI
jgi:hypothetical protein